MQYSLLLPTDKLKQSLPFSDYKHFDYHSRESRGVVVSALDY